VVKFFTGLFCKFVPIRPVAESLNVTASLVLRRVSRVPIGGLSNSAHRRGFTNTPDLVKKVDFEGIECPECGEKF
jgi:hypothetical protein